jgi:hypothetical protein
MVQFSQRIEAEWPLRLFGVAGLAQIENRPPLGLFAKAGHRFPETNFWLDVKALLGQPV